MITGLYSAKADSIFILCITGQAPRARIFRKDFQAVDIESIAKPAMGYAKVLGVKQLNRLVGIEGLNWCAAHQV